MPVLSNAPSGKLISVIQGEYAVSGDPNIAMSTVLGSCIAACMYDREVKVGGMNHFLLPEAQTGDGQNVKYGAYLMELLINDLLKIGAQRHRLRTKLLGGGKMSQFLGGVGEKNIIFARRYLQSEGIPLEWESLGGLQARRIIFSPTTGDVKEKFIQQNLQSETTATPVLRRRQDDVTLF